MITIEYLTRERVVRSLYSRTCPACGGSKSSQKTLCYKQFCALPREIKDALYKRVGQGYEQALLRALQFLKATEFHEQQSQLQPRAN